MCLHAIVCFVYLIGQGECYVHYFLHSRTFQFRNTTVIHRRYISCFISLSLLPRLSGVTACLIVLPLFYKVVTYMTIINTHSLIFFFKLIHISYIFGVVFEMGNFHLVSSYRTCTESLFLLCARYTDTHAICYFIILFSSTCLRLEQSKRLL